VPGPILQHPAYVTPDRDAFALAAAGEPLASDDPSHERGDLAGAFALLAKMSQDFALSLDIATTLERALALIAAQLDAEAGSLWLTESDGLEVACHACVGPHPITGLRLSVAEGIVGHSVRDNLCQCVLDVAKDPHFSRTMDAQSGFVTRSILCAPMPLAERAIGAIELINRRGGDGLFSESDARRLQVLAACAALAIANARTAETLVEHERVRRELELAAGIQRALLPSPRPDPFPVCGVNIAARTLSGDFYDIVPLADSRIAFCVADVAGQDLHALLLMAKTASLYRCLAKRIASPAALLAALDVEISETATHGSFVKLVAGIFDPTRGEAVFANAGLEPVLLHGQAGGFSSFPTSAAPLGSESGSVFPETRVALDGGTLYVCSDGLIAATCAESRERLGSEGLMRLILRFASKPPAARIAAIASDAGRVELSDDLTLLAVTDTQRRIG
jgi:sigma-B regulation protein RsbU (phosphoserine phosphatase)